jgi:hypothetical protein
MEGRREARKHDVRRTNFNCTVSKTSDKNDKTFAAELARRRFVTFVTTFLEIANVGGFAAFHS